MAKALGCQGRERGRAKSQVDKAAGTANRLGLAVTSGAGPEPCSNGPQLWVQGGRAWCKGTWRSPRGGSSRAGPGSRVEAGSFQPGFPLPLSLKLCLACGICSFYSAFYPLVLVLAWQVILSPWTLESELFDIPCPIFPASPAPLFQSPVSLPPESTLLSCPPSSVLQAARAWPTSLESVPCVCDQPVRPASWKSAPVSGRMSPDVCLAEIAPSAFCRLVPT